MPKVLTPFTVDQQILLEAALADDAPVRPFSEPSKIAMLELVRQGLFMPDGGGWSLTNRGLLVARGIQRQGKIASGGTP